MVGISKIEREYLRDLAKKVQEYAFAERNHKNAERWQKHNDLQDFYPMVFCDAENGWQEVLGEYGLKCEDRTARFFEWELLRLVAYAEKIRDDRVLDGIFYCPLVADGGNWGIVSERIGGENNTAYAWDAPIKDFERDLEKMRYPEPTVDFQASKELFECAQEEFGDILKVQRYHSWWWTLGLTMQYVYLRGWVWEKRPLRIYSKELKGFKCFPTE